MIQHKAPQNAGRKAETKVHHLLFVSLYSVIRVVEQGQCIREKSRTQTAVFQV